MWFSVIDSFMDISASEFNARYRYPNSFFIVDVREELEFKTFNLGGENIPIGSLVRRVKDLPFPKDAEIVVICQHGIRSQTALSILSENGYSRVRNLAGGLIAWKRVNINAG
jgi:rhodanese-related sulfurtransferase